MQPLGDCDVDRGVLRELDSVFSANTVAVLNVLNRAAGSDRRRKATIDKDHLAGHEV